MLGGTASNSLCSLLDRRNKVSQDVLRKSVNLALSVRCFPGRVFQNQQDACFPVISGGPFGAGKLDSACRSVSVINRTFFVDAGEQRAGGDWSAGLFPSIVLGMVARGDTQVPEHAILCFLPEVQSVIVNNSCSMRLSTCMVYYTAPVSYSHSVFLHVMVLNT